MIARAWHGVTAAEHAEVYLEYLDRTGARDYRQTEGNRGVYVLHRIEGDRADFLLISLWDSYDAIRQFAGDDIEASHYYDEDKQYLLELEPRVVHYEVMAAP